MASTRRGPTRRQASRQRCRPGPWIPPPGGCKTGIVRTVSEVGRKTICVSTQAGCAIGCVFCVTGQFGFARNLDAGEILEQVLRFCSAEHPVTNVVFMGMGEPMANYDETVRAIRLLTHPYGL